MPSLTSLEAGSLEDWLGFKTKVSLVALHEFTNGKGPGVGLGAKRNCRMLPQMLPDDSIWSFVF